MALISGTRLGPYEILAPIGAGGMGEVYKATDTRLDRTVAIKVLPEHLAGSPERKARFEREAKAISQLNHPHICTLYDVGEQDGIDFIVMEYIEGETLAERLKKGALPLEQALEYGIQIANGLDAAHRAGIVHRDLKPPNVMLTKSGVKLLDYGLAKLVEEDVGPETSDAPTRQKHLTQEESLIGTLQYMAPEQLERKTADARTDIFAFGAVLYEMVSGRKAFQGNSQASLITAIMSSDPPPMSELQPLAPSLLDHLVRRCLEKDRDLRWQSALDLASELTWTADELRTRGPDAPSPMGRGRTWGLVGLAAGALVAGAVFWSTPKPTPSTPTRFILDIPSDQELETRTRPNGSFASSPVAVSPDGTRLVYAARAGGSKSMLYLRELERWGARAIPGTEGGRDPFFSPDGEWVGFRTADALKKVPLGGGAAVKIVDAPAEGSGGSWGTDDTIVYESGGSALMRVSAAGGESEPATDFAGAPHWGPQYLPDGHSVLFARSSGLRLAVASLDTGEARTVEGLTDVIVQWGRYLPTGHLVYATSNGMMAVAFDPDRRQVTGSPVSVLGGVPAYFLAFSETGTLVYVSQDNLPGSLVWVDREGRVSPIEEAGRFAYHFPRLSPDGGRVAVDAIADGDIWIHELTRGTRMRLTMDGTVSNSAWTPDGSELAFNGPGDDIYRMPADGSGEAELLLEREHAQWPMSWSPDGRALAFTESHPATGRDTWVLPADGEPIPFLVTPFNEGAAKFSPDGRFLAYQSDESGQNEVYVRPYPGPGGKWLVSLEGGTEPVWSPDGTELFYRQGDAMMAVPTTLGSAFSAGRPVKLFEGDFQRDTTGHPFYDVDGERFLMVRGVESETRAQIHVVLNWFDELKRLVPTEN